MHFLHFMNILVNPHPTFLVEKSNTNYFDYRNARDNESIRPPKAQELLVAQNVIISPRSCYSSIGSQTSRLADRSLAVEFESVSVGNNDEVDITSESVTYDLEFTPATSTARSICSTTRFFEDLPALALTVPTPLIPQSPIFAPRSPVTLQKFMAASERFLDDSASICSPFAVPTIPNCPECTEVRRQRQEEFQDETDEGDLSSQQWFCRACHRQWLACQVWYQASDGGTRQHLREPFIKPAEANNSNRALMELLGVPSVRALDEAEVMKGIVVGIRDVSDSVGVGRVFRGIANRKLGQSLKRKMRRFSGSWAMVNEVGQIVASTDSDSPRSSRRLSGFWQSVKTSLRLQR